MSDTYLYLQPGSPDSRLPIGGDIQHNTGLVVEGILKLGDKAHGKLAILVLEYLRQEDNVKIWSRVTGKKAQFIGVSDDVYEGMWGPWGSEMATQFRWSDAYPDWHVFYPDKTLTFAELGVEGKLVGHEAALEAIKGELL